MALLELCRQVLRAVDVVIKDYGLDNLGQLWVLMIEVSVASICSLFLIRT